MSLKPSIAVDLLIAPNCPHCANVMQVLTTMIKDSEIASLRIRNLGELPELATELNIKSVPWVKIGPFELTGSMSKTELNTWIKRVNSEDGMKQYFISLFAEGELDKATQLIYNTPDLLKIFPEMIADESTPLGAKIGIGAILEDLQGKKELLPLISDLAKLSESPVNNIRLDACYYLGLTESIKAKPYIQKLLNDKDKEVRETAEDALQMLKS